MLTIALLPYKADAEAPRVVTYPTSAEDKHFYNVPYSGLFRALNGKFHDKSIYFASKTQQLNISGFTAFFFPNEWTLKFDWTIDRGFNSELYDVDPSLVSDIEIIKFFENTKIELGLSNAFFVGGRVSERACIDELAREFHCGTGLPWSDHIPHRILNNIGFSINWTVYF